LREWILDTINVPEICLSSFVLRFSFFAIHYSVAQMTPKVRNWWVNFSSVVERQNGLIFIIRD
jgi:hypothetical protein